MPKSLPSILIQGKVKNFDEIANEYHLIKKSIRKGEVLTEYGVINNTSHFVVEGIMQLDLLNNDGEIKSVALFGKNSVFPLGVEPHENYQDYEMVLTAFTDMIVYSFSYTLLNEICTNNGELSAEILGENCEFVGLLFYSIMNDNFNGILRKIADMLFLQYYFISKNTNLLITQKELTKWCGGSRAQVERCIMQLKEDRIIAVTYGKIQIINKEKLLDCCSDYIAKLDD